MFHRHTYIKLLILVAANFICLPFVLCADKEVEILELKTALEAALKKNEILNKNLAEFEATNSNLKNSLMASNAEAVEFRKSYNDVRLQLEAYGIESVTDGKSGVETRLLKAMNDIRILEEEKLMISEALINLSDVTLQLVDVSKSEENEENGEFKEEGE